jgi:hypothetical protein
MYEWIKDPIRGWCLVPEWMAEMCRAERGFGIDREADRRAYNSIHSAAPASAKVTPQGAAPAFTGDDLVGKPKPSGWAEPRPLGPPPGVALADRIVDAQDQRDRVEAAFRRRLKP